MFVSGWDVGEGERRGVHGRCVVGCRGGMGVRVAGWGMGFFDIVIIEGVRDVSCLGIIYPLA